MAQMQGAALPVDIMDGVGPKLSRVLSFVHRANRLSVCPSGWLAGLVSLMPIESVFSAPAPPSWGLNGDVPASSPRGRSSEDQFSGWIISATS
jgi:hypothetical protein